MSHLPESAYAPAAAGGGAAHESYASARQHPRNTTNGGGHDSGNGIGSGVGGVANEFRAPYQGQDGFSGGHWSQPSPYANAYQQNQFAAPNGSSHPSYPTSHASAYGSGVGGAPTHPGSYSFPMQQQHQHHRGPSHLHMSSGPYQHESGPNTPNGGALTSQHAQSGLNASPAYHSPSIAGMVPGLPHQHAGAHQGYPSHYASSLVPNAGPGPTSGLSQQGVSISPSAALNTINVTREMCCARTFLPGQVYTHDDHLTPQAVGSPAYPSGPQYSTQVPMAGRHRVTTTLWEDEGTLCFQVEAKGVCVARRHGESLH